LPGFKPAGITKLIWPGDTKYSGADTCASALSVIKTEVPPSVVGSEALDAATVLDARFCPYPEAMESRATDEPPL
jgi:hypothetical protein